MGWVCETGNVLKDYNFPEMLGKNARRLSKKREPGYKAMMRIAIQQQTPPVTQNAKLIMAASSVERLEQFEKNWPGRRVVYTILGKIL